MEDEHREEEKYNQVTELAILMATYLYISKLNPGTLLKYRQGR